MMNNQEIFDKVTGHLLKQATRSVLEKDKTCAYRGDDGLKCAVGCLISDGNYYPKLEGKSVDSDEVINVLEKEGIDINNSFDMLNELQFLHDNVDPQRWHGKLQAVANNFDLNFKF